MKLGRHKRVALNDEGKAAMSKGKDRTGTVRAVCEKYSDCRRVVWDGQKTDHIVPIKFLKHAR